MGSPLVFFDGVFLITIFFVFDQSRPKKKATFHQMRSPALRALVGFGGTLAALGGATLAVSTATSAVIRVAVRARQAKRMVPCKSCCNPPSTSSSTSTPGKRRCSVCQGRRAVRWQPFSAPLTARWTLCPLCAGKGEQPCWNCSGSGQVVGSDEEVAKERAERRRREADAAAEVEAAAAAETIEAR